MELFFGFRVKLSHIIGTILFSKSFTPCKWTLKGFEFKMIESKIKQQIIQFSEVAPVRNKMTSVLGYKRRLSMPVWLINTMP